MEKEIEFANEEAVPRTAEETDRLFNRAMEIAINRTKEMVVSVDQEEIPREILMIQLLTLAVNGLARKHNWSEQDLHNRISLHKLWEQDDNQSESE